MSPPDSSTLPPDDGECRAIIAKPDDDLPHVAVAGDVYTIFLSGEDTAGRYCLIDMRVSPGGGPPPHRYNFEETFSVLEGEIELTVRGETYTVTAGSLAHVPANAPHAFTNASEAPARSCARAHRRARRSSSVRSVCKSTAQTSRRPSSAMRRPRRWRGGR